MASLGSLIVELAIDAARFTGALDKAGHDAEKFAKRVDKAVGDAKRQTLQFVTSVAGAAAILAEFREAVNYGDALKKASEQTGVAIAQLDQLAIAAKLNDVTLDGLAKSFKFLNAAMNEADKEGSEAAAIFKRFGIEIRDASGQMIATDKVFQQLLPAFKTFKEDANLSAAAQKLLGRSFIEMKPLIANYEEDMARASEAVRAFGGYNDEVADSADEVGDQFSLIGEGAKRLFIPLLEPARVIVTGLKDAFIALYPAMNAVASVIGGTLYNGFKLIHGILATVWGVLNGLMGAFLEFGGALEALVRRDFASVAVHAGNAARVFQSSITDTEKYLVNFYRQVDAYDEGKTGNRWQEGRGFGAFTTGAKSAKTELQKLTEELDKFLASSANKSLAEEVGLDEKTVEMILKAEQAYNEAGISLAKYNAIIAAAINSDKVLTKQQDDIAAAFKKTTDEVEKYVAEMEAAEEAKAAGLDPKTIDIINKAATAYLGATKNYAAFQKVVELALKNDPVRNANEQKILDIWKSQSEALADLEDAYKAHSTSMLQSVEALEAEARAVGLTREEIEKLTLAKQRDAALQYAGSADEYDRIMELYRRGVSAIDQRKVAEGLSAGVQRGMDMAAGYLNDFVDIAAEGFMDLVQNGQDAWERIGQSFKRLVLDVIQQFIVRPIIVRMLASVGGGMGFSAETLASVFGPGAGGGGAGGFGGIGDLFGGGGGGGIMGSIGSLFSSFATSSFGNSLGLSVAAGLGETSGLMLAPALASIGSVLSMALPIIGIGMAIASMFGAFDSKGGPKTGGFAQSEGLNLERFFTPDQQDSAMRELIGTVEDSYTALITGLGGKGTATFAAGFDTDPEGTANNRAVIESYVNGILAYQFKSGDESLGRDAEKLQETLELESKRALLAALQASEFPQQIAAILNSVSAASATAEDIDNLVGVATAVKAIMDVLDRDIGADVAEAMDVLTSGPLGALDRMGENIGELIATFDGTAEAAQNLAQATAEYYDAGVQLLVQIEQIRDALSGPFGLFEQTRRNLTYQTLEDDAKYEFLRADALRLQNLIAESSDPEEIARLAQMANQDLIDAFNLLSPEEQQAQLGEFLAGLDRLDDLTTERLDAVEQTVTDTVGTVMGEVLLALDDIAKKMGDSADKQMVAADKQQRAADTPIKIDVNITNEEQVVNA